MTESLSARAYASAVRMHQDSPTMAKPRIEDFAYLDAGRPAVPGEGAGPVPPPDATPDAPGWDASAFDALPPEMRAGVIAGTAVQVGRHALDVAAEQELRRPADIHLHLTDPGRYVDSEGRVDRQAIARDVEQVVRDRPELARYGTSPGQEPHRPDERRRAPDPSVGAALAAVPGGDLNSRVQATLDRMQAETRTRFTPPPQDAA